MTNVPLSTFRKNKFDFNVSFYIHSSPNKRRMLTQRNYCPGFTIRVLLSSTSFVHLVFRGIPFFK